MDRSFEMRIFLKEKLLKVSDYPNYENVCELNDISRINLSMQYRFGIQLHYENTTITITDIFEVPEFDLRMWWHFIKRTIYSPLSLFGTIKQTIFYKLINHINYGKDTLCREGLRWNSFFNNTVIFCKIIRYFPHFLWK